MKHKNTNEIYLYWNRIRGNNLAPDRCDIEPTDIRRLLSDTFILEVNGPDQYDFRLAGTRICRIFGQEMKNRNILDMMTGESREAIQTILHSTTEDASVNVAGFVGKSESGRSLAIEAIFLPLNLRGRRDARILGTFSPVKVPFWMGMEPVKSLELASFRMILSHQHRNEVGRMLETRKAEDEETIVRPEQFATNIHHEARRVGHLYVYEGGAPN